MRTKLLYDMDTACFILNNKTPN